MLDLVVSVGAGATMRFLFGFGTRHASSFELNVQRHAAVSSLV